MAMVLCFTGSCFTGPNTACRCSTRRKATKAVLAVVAALNRLAEQLPPPNGGEAPASAADWPNASHIQLRANCLALAR